MVRHVRILCAAAAVTLSLSVVSAAVAPGHASAADGSSVVVNPGSGPPGATVTGTGTDWQAGDTIQAEWGDNDSDLGSPVTVAGNGTFADTFSLPSTATAGAHQILFWDEQARYFEVADFTVTSSPPSSPPTSSCPSQSPQVDLTKTAGPVGTGFTADGTGWDADQKVSVSLPYGSKGIFGVSNVSWNADSNGDWVLNITVGQTPPGVYEIDFQQSVCGGLKVAVRFTVTPRPTPTPALPDLLTDTHLPACIISLAELAGDLWAARYALGALETWHDAVTLLSLTGSLANFYKELRTNSYWGALLNAALIDPLNDCVIGVQILLDDTSGVAGEAVAKWILKYLHARKPIHHAK